ncbi:MAG: polyphosphate kinase 1 [bacterium]|nr:polyphosphate kinase 1 [bacterium]
MTTLESISRPLDLDSSEFYFNRELSWLDFNSRVLDEALSQDKPLLERVKFLSIFSSNLDEFFMVRVSGLRRQLESGTLSAPPDGMTPSEQLAGIRERLVPELKRRTRAWEEDLRPALAAVGIYVHDYDHLKKKQRKLMRDEFKKEIFPILTPLAVDLSHPFPHISNRSINLAVVIRDPKLGERFARVKVPHVLTRFRRIPSEEGVDDPRRLGLESDREAHFVWLEQIVSANLDRLFPGLEVVAAHPFRITRDADQEIEEDEASDLMTAMQEVVDQRHFGSVIRLEVDSKMPESIRAILIKNLGLAPYQVFDVEGPMGLSDLLELGTLDRPELKDPPFLPVFPADMTGDADLFRVIRSRDVLVYHPYDSFRPVVDFVSQAASDPDVVAIKQTLYRVGLNSPIVDALMEARENGKQVSAIVELRARFDEEKNINWAQALEQAGVHVVYGVQDLKVHAKMCLVVRRERDGIRRYVHVGTGNYNAVTTRVYTDIGLFTDDPQLVADVSDLFNALTGYSLKSDYRKLLVSPHSMRRQLIEKVEREIERHKSRGDGHLVFKMNSLVDKELIQTLYRASHEGVRIDLQVRGICCLRPGVSGLSDNIDVTSIVGRFLEHSRIYYFHNGGAEELYLGSADLMPRNLDGRVEILVPVEDPRLRDLIRDDILFAHLADTAQASRLLSDGTYARIASAAGGEVMNSQILRLEQPGPWLAEE